MEKLCTMYDEKVDSAKMISKSQWVEREAAESDSTAELMAVGSFHVGSYMPFLIAFVIFVVRFYIYLNQHSDIRSPFLDTCCGACSFLTYV